jgi:hypothetical protein
MASFYDSASIITIPSGYKAGTLYSQIPTDGTGDMTFTRTGDTATRVNSAGIIERCITNLALQSNNFSSASWAKSNVTIAGSIADPNGGTTAFSMAGTSATSNSKNINQFPFAAVNQPKTLSIYAKANTHSFIQIRNSDSTNFSNFDLTTGTFSAGATALARMTSIGGGWYRCSISYSSSATGYNLHLVDSLAAAHAASSTTTNSVYIWRAQAETEDIPTNYIDTTIAAVTEGPVTNLPRLDYFGSTCPQLLMEPTRTNLATYSQMFDNSAWSKNTSSVSGNVLVSPDGYTNADLLIEDTNLGRHSVGRDVSFVSGTTYTMSCFVKQGSGTRRFALFTPTGAFTTAYVSNFNLQTGVVTNSHPQIVGKIENYGNGWYRCSAVATANITNVRAITYMLRTSDAASVTEYTGDGTSSMYIWGAQVEAGAYASSYIPTTAATVSRTPDVCNKTSASALIGQTEGTLFAEFKVPSVDSSTNFIGLQSGAFTNCVLLGKESAPTPDKFLFYIQASGVVILNNTSLTLTSDYVKCAIAYKSGDWAAYYNGTQIASGTSTFSFSSALNIFGFGSNATLSVTGDQTNIKQALVFKTRLSNADLATLTTL